MPTTGMAQGLPVHTETALTTAFEQRGARVTLGSRGRDGLTAVRFAVSVLPFAPHEYVTTVLTVPVHYQRTDGPAGTQLRSLAPGDLTAGVKWAFFVRNRPGETLRGAVIGAVTAPTGATDLRFDDGTLAPGALQPGLGTWAGGATTVWTWVRGAWGINADLGHRRALPDGNRRRGAVTRYDVAAGLRFPRYVPTIRTPTVQVYVEWNGMIMERSRVAGVPDDATGGHVGFLSPAVQWVPRSSMLLELSLQIPLVDDRNGTPPSLDVRPAAGIRVLF